MGLFGNLFSRSRWGMRILAAGLILWGLVHFVPSLQTVQVEHLLAILAIAAGVLIFLDR
jgi:hypothetical protein